jgi:hypothetical protein
MANIAQHTPLLSEDGDHNNSQCSCQIQRSTKTRFWFFVSAVAAFVSCVCSVFNMFLTFHQPAVRLHSSSLNRYERPNPYIGIEKVSEQSLPPVINLPTVVFHSQTSGKYYHDVPQEKTPWGIIYPLRRNITVTPTVSTGIISSFLPKLCCFRCRQFCSSASWITASKIVNSWPAYLILRMCKI